MSPAHLLPSMGPLPPSSALRRPRHSPLSPLYFHKMTFCEIRNKPTFHFHFRRHFVSAESANGQSRPSHSCTTTPRPSSSRPLWRHRGVDRLATPSITMFNLLPQAALAVLRCAPPRPGLAPALAASVQHLLPSLTQSTRHTHMLYWPVILHAAT